MTSSIAMSAPMPQAGRLARFVQAYMRQPRAIFGLAMLVASALIALLAPWIVPYDPDAMDAMRLLPVSAEHLMGTDHLGRDVFSRVLMGTRVSMSFAFGAAALSFLIGTSLGAVAGYAGGWTDHILNRVFELFVTIPMLFLVILLSALFGSSILIAAIVVGITIWPSNALMTRAQVLSLKSRMFVRSAKAVGASHSRILFMHILPNGIQPVIVNSTLQVGAAILLEASLSFLGLGDPNYPSWGQMLREAQPYLSMQWTCAIFPGLAIAWLVVSVALTGDGVNGALNRMNA